jgi:hypothetical protein
MKLAAAPMEEGSLFGPRDDDHGFLAALEPLDKADVGSITRRSQQGAFRTVWRDHGDRVRVLRCWSGSHHLADNFPSTALL